MPSVTYTVLRSIIRVPFESLQKTDVSVNVAGSPEVYSFDSVAGDFAGLKAGEWVLTSGFANAANNVWSQLSIDSTANKITVTNTLSVEAAGNTVDVIGYLHGKGEELGIDMRFFADNRNREITKFKAVAINGNTETLTQRRENYFNITSNVLIPSEYKQYKQFLDSCESGEGFVFDREGTLANVDKPLSAFLDSDGYSEQRLANNIDKQIAFRILS